MLTKKAILLVSFGTSRPEAKKTFANIDTLARKRFPNTEIRWAYTSKMIRKKLLKQGEVIFSPQMALAKLSEDGYTHIAVQSLHTIPGVEYERLKLVIDKASTAPALFNNIVLGMPLLSSHEVTLKVMQSMLHEIPNERTNEDAVIFMGHGTKEHYSDLIYTAAASIVNDLDQNTYLATVEGYNSIHKIIEECLKKNIKKAYLIPFMSVAGMHAQEDLAGDSEKSWKSILAKNNINCEIIMRGTADIDSIVSVWLDHLENALNSTQTK